MTKDHLRFTKRLIHLSRQHIGIKEAALLFALQDGATVKEASAALKEDKAGIRSRLNILKRKRLTECLFKADGTPVHHLTERGRTLISTTINQ